VQELLGHDLFQGNRTLLERAWTNPAQATEYDLTAPLNQAAFAHTFTFQSVIAECQFDGNQLSRVVLHPVEEGYGSRLLLSGIPRLVTDAAQVKAIVTQIVEQTARFGLTPLNITYAKQAAVIRP